jgi:hypothetical protein
VNSASTIINGLAATTHLTELNVSWTLLKKYIEFGSPENVAYEIPEEYRPVLDTTERYPPSWNEHALQREPVPEAKPEDLTGVARSYRHP